MHTVIEDQADYDTDMPNAHDDSAYSPEELEAAYARMAKDACDSKFLLWEVLRQHNLEDAHEAECDRLERASEAAFYRKLEGGAP